MKKDDAVFNTMPLFYCRDNTDVIYFSSLIQAKKTLSNAAMYGNYIARKLLQYVEGKACSNCAPEESVWEVHFSTAILRLLFLI